MAVIQTPHGRVIGLIPTENQPKPEPVADNETEETVEPVFKKPGRAAKK